MISRANATMVAAVLLILGANAANSADQTAIERAEAPLGENESAQTRGDDAVADPAAAQRSLAQHAIAMHGAPALPPDFTHLPYVNPSAPQGGRAVYGERGGFDSLNPYIVRGRSVWGLRDLVFESLMERSWDEPFSLYGLLAESVSTPPDRSSVTYTLRPEARFSNGAPVTVDDLIWSMETLRDEGLPSFRNMYGQVARVERVGERGARFVFAAPNRELPLLLGLMPIFSKESWRGRDFSAGGLAPPVGSGPYEVAIVEAERRLLLTRDPDYWGADLPINRGRFNFDEIEYLFFRDGSAMWEAFTAGRIDFFFDFDPANWADAYTFPAALDGRVRRAEVPHARPSGLRGFVFNTRRPIFQDRRIREALALAFDFEWLNQRFFRDGYDRIGSYFSGSSLAHDLAAETVEAGLLSPFVSKLPAETMERAWRPPAGAGDGRNRRNLRQARALLAEAGWTVQDGVLRNAAGEAFAFEIMVRAVANERIAQAFADMLKPIGVAASIRLVDGAQYQERLTAFDYDMIAHGWFASLSPGEEQRQYWGSRFADAPGSRNYMGVRDPAIDAMIDEMLRAETRADFESAARALDRVLASGVYVIPFGYLTSDRVAWRAEFDKPELAPLYGLRRDVWWRRPE